MDPNNIRLYKGNGIYFIKDQYKKDTFFEYEDAYNYYDIDVDKIALFKMNILLDTVILIKLYHYN